ncbi:MAG: DNA-3-methyladenine glycosylase [Verrucomicrobium sp.]|nr:DNA-3-methyladenine glycosylase [Verrucomicrobium sp.]
MKGLKLPLQAYLDPDPVAQARFFLGKQVVVQGPEGRCAALITETEAYGGAPDKACHGYNHRRTPRTEPLFAPGGIAYVYLCYGLHNMLNFVTGPQGEPMAVLIRAVRVVEGRDLAARRRPGIPESRWAAGPGMVCQALGIERADNRAPLTGARLWVEDIGLLPMKKEIAAGPRIGVAYAAEWAAKPWRFIWQPPEAALK